MICLWGTKRSKISPIRLRLHLKGGARINWLSRHSYRNCKATNRTFGTSFVVFEHVGSMQIHVSFDPSVRGLRHGLRRFGDLRLSCCKLRKIYVLCENFINCPLSSWSIIIIHESCLLLHAAFRLWRHPKGGVIPFGPLFYSFLCPFYSSFLWLFPELSLYSFSEIESASIFDVLYRAPYHLRIP